jgi:hypothetical protein
MLRVLELLGETKVSTVKLPYGKPIKLLLDLQGFPDGRLVIYEVWRKNSVNEEKIAELYGVTKRNKALAIWNPDFLDGNTFELQESPINEKIDETYYFIGKIDDKEIKSADMKLTFPLTLFVKEGEEPLNVPFKITFSDGTANEGKFVKGLAEFKNAPLGSFKIELNGYTQSVWYGVLKR